MIYEVCSTVTPFMSLFMRHYVVEEWTVLCNLPCSTHYFKVWFALTAFCKWSNHTSHHNHVMLKNVVAYIIFSVPNRKGVTSFFKWINIKGTCSTWYLPTKFLFCCDVHSKFAHWQITQKHWASWKGILLLHVWAWKQLWTLKMIN